MGRVKEGPLTMERYHRFFLDPWSTGFTNDQLNHIIFIHGFTKLHRSTKEEIMKHLVGQVDLEPPRRSTLHAAARLPAANIVTEQAAADVDAIGWTECPISCVAVFAGFGEDPPEPLEPMPPPADRVLSLAVRRARSKRTRGSAYPRRVRAASKEAKVKEEDLEEGEIWQPPPSPPPMRIRSPTPPPPPPSSPRPQTLVRPPSSLPCTVRPKLEPILSLPPGSGSRPPPCWSRPTLAPLPTPPSGFVSRPPPCWNQHTLAPLPTPPSGFGSRQVQVTPPPPQVSWCLPLPMVPRPSGPGAPPAFTHHLQPAGQPPHWQPTVPPSYPAPSWGAPSVLPPQQVPWRWPLPPPRWAPPHLQQHQRRPPPWGCMRPSAPPAMPPQYPSRFQELSPGVAWARPRPVFQGLLSS